MSLTDGMDPERARDIGQQLQDLGRHTSEIQQSGMAMIRVLEDVWAGPDVEVFAAGWGQVSPRVHEAGAGIEAAGRAIVDQADDQEQTSSSGAKGTGGGDGGGDDDTGWWDEAKDFGRDLLDRGEDFVDTVSDTAKDLGSLVDEGLTWANEQWKEVVSTDVLQTITDWAKSVGEWFDELPWWGKGIIGVVIAAVAIAAIVFLGAPVLATLAVAATIWGVIEGLDEIAEFLQDPWENVKTWWAESSVFAKVVTIGSVVLAPFGGRILGPVLRKLDGPAEKAADWLRKKLGREGDPPKPPTIPPRRHDYTDEDGNPVTSRYADDQIDTPSADQRLDDTLARHGMTREDFDRALLEEVPADPADLTPDQRTVMDIRTEMGAPKAGEPMQKVLTSADYERYVGGEPTVQGSVTRLNDGVEMRTPRELHDGLRLDYGKKEDRVFSPDDESVQVLRFRTREGDADISRFSSMGGKSGTDGWDPPYTGNGFTRSTDPVVPESRLPNSPLRAGSEVWTVRADGSQELDMVFDGKEWVKVQ